MKTDSVIRKSAYAGAAFFGTVGMLSVGYSAYSGLASVSVGQTLTASAWNQMKNNFDDVDSRLSAFSFSSGKVGIGTSTPSDKLSVSGSISANYLNVNSQDGSNEGGELRLRGAGTNGDIQIDNFQGNIRFHTLASGKYFQILGGAGIMADGLSDSAGVRMDAGGGWMRTYGDTGWYSQTYGGGWNMTDSTWIRAYGGKSVYSPGEVQATTVRANTNLCIGTDCKTAWPTSASGFGARTAISFGTSYCPGKDAIVVAYKRSSGAVNQGLSVVVAGTTVAISTGQSEGHLGYNNVSAPIRKGECFTVSDIGAGDSRYGYYMTLN